MLRGPCETQRQAPREVQDKTGALGIPRQQLSLGRSRMISCKVRLVLVQEGDSLWAQDLIIAARGNYPKLVPICSQSTAPSRLEGGKAGASVGNLNAVKQVFLAWHPHINCTAGSAERNIHVIAAAARCFRRKPISMPQCLWLGCSGAQSWQEWIWWRPACPGVSGQFRVSAWSRGAARIPAARPAEKPSRRRAPLSGEFVPCSPCKPLTGFPECNSARSASS